MGSLTPQDIALWPMPNYIDPVTRVHLILGVEIPLTVIMSFFMGVRLVAKRNLNALGDGNNYRIIISHTILIIT
ncbi:hypothetical protein AOQ84DRAFT_380543 [Glonium stellatum]|uniref:Uncharacterized protein n=1 Tax=Glonium stellatum TaxID=574774 RepID=A0A8E2ETC5_9PEZI|nr:hypothetical protein AOQ84DRAFT_380543 [Glonium stellatum]